MLPPNAEKVFSMCRSQSDADEAARTAQSFDGAVVLTYRGEQVIVSGIPFVSDVLPQVLTFVVTKEQADQIERAVELASDGTPGRDRKAKGLANLASRFLAEPAERVGAQ